MMARFVLVLCLLFITVPAIAQTKADLAQCKGLLGQASLGQGVDLDKVCSCMMQKSNQTSFNTDADIDKMMQEMTACMNEQVAKPQSPAKKAGHTAEKPAATAPKSPAKPEKSAAAGPASVPARQGNKNVKYDPKTGVWSN